eukprot:TRINITY_DN9205_c0_g1_i1.p1 TRINITY_DN9205_c0_g1~~TRINITY_DN9205_c0_g1_i1.p1  ORF type:complete len:1096 (+),score=205.73 TRINITY_DN9205_c0_g1_i1:51-3338(+)
MLSGISTANSESLRARETHLMRFLTPLLRRNAKRAGLVLDSDGYAALDDVMRLPQITTYRYSAAEIISHIRQDPAGRLEVSEDEAGVYFIRATFGHSHELHVTIKYPELKAVPEQGHFVSEMSLAKWDRARVKGLHSKTKTCVQLMTVELAQQLILQDRRKPSKEVAVYVDVRKAVKEGLIFYTTPHGVILTDGIRHHIPQTLWVRANNMLHNAQIQPSEYLNTVEHVATLRSAGRNRVSVLGFNFHSASRHAVGDDDNVSFAGSEPLVDFDLPSAMHQSNLNDSLPTRAATRLSYSASSEQTPRQQQQPTSVQKSPSVAASSRPRTATSRAASRGATSTIGPSGSTAMPGVDVVMAIGNAPPPPVLVAGLNTSSHGLRPPFPTGASTATPSTPGASRALQAASPATAGGDLNASVSSMPTAAAGQRYLNPKVLNVLEVLQATAELLRHGDSTLSLDDRGYVPLKDICSRSPLRRFDFHTLIDLYKNDVMGRVQLREFQDVIYVRAAFGHSRPLGERISRVAISGPSALPQFCVYLCTARQWQWVLARGGLSTKDRNEVGLLSDALYAKVCETGECEMFDKAIMFDVRQMQKDGVEVWRLSEDMERGLVFTKGDQNLISKEYFLRVMDIRSGEVVQPEVYGCVSQVSRKVQRPGSAKPQPPPSPDVGSMKRVQIFTGRLGSAIDSAYTDEDEQPHQPQVPPHPSFRSASPGSPFLRPLTPGSTITPQTGDVSRVGTPLRNAPSPIPPSAASSPLPASVRNMMQMRQRQQSPAVQTPQQPQLSQSNLPPRPSSAVPSSRSLAASPAALSVASAASARPMSARPSTRQSAPKHVTLASPTAVATSFSDAASLVPSASDADMRTTSRLGYHADELRQRGGAMTPSSADQSGGVFTHSNAVWTRIEDALRSGKRILFIAPPAWNKSAFAAAANKRFAQPDAVTSQLVDCDQLLDLGSSFHVSQKFKQDLYAESANLVTLINSDHVHRFFIGCIPFHEHYIQLKNVLVVPLRSTIQQCIANSQVKFTSSDRAYHPAFANEYAQVIRKSHEDINRLIREQLATDFGDVCDALLMTVYDIEPTGLAGTNGNLYSPIPLPLLQ